MKRKDCSGNNLNGAKPLYIDGIKGEGVASFFATRFSATERGKPYDCHQVLSELGLGDAVIIRAEQVHGDRVEVIDKMPSEPVIFPETDAMITNVPGVILTTVHADCLPVYLFDPVKKTVAMVHGGWRGTQKNIAVKAAEQMNKNFGSSPGDILAHIGPGISICCFETGPEVYDAFAENFDDIDSFAKRKPAEKITEKETVKYHIDLKGITQRRLEEFGIKESNITVSNHCTCCEPELFCSYRRDGESLLRMTAGIGLL